LLVVALTLTAVVAAVVVTALGLVGPKEVTPPLTLLLKRPLPPLLLMQTLPLLPAEAGAMAELVGQEFLAGLQRNTIRSQSTGRNTQTTAAESLA
jgi:hypothetical protein